MMKGGARLRLDLDEGWCETLHGITIHHKGIDLDEGWCETLHYITIHQKRIDLDEGWCETLHYIIIHHKGMVEAVELTLMKGGRSHNNT